MQIIYTGPDEAVYVSDLDCVVAAGEPVDAPDDVAARLLEQESWTQAKPIAKPKPT